MPRPPRIYRRVEARRSLCVISGIDAVGLAVKEGCRRGEASCLALVDLAAGGRFRGERSLSVYCLARVEAHGGCQWQSDRILRLRGSEVIRVAYCSLSDLAPLRTPQCVYREGIV
jgi:hypothetical protein